MGFEFVDGRHDLKPAPRALRSSAALTLLLLCGMVFAGDLIIDILSLSFTLPRLTGWTHGLRLKEVRIPNHTVRDACAHLECQYDLDGESLYSVKWYKDGNEFYRYVPRDMPPAQVFALPGVTVDVSISRGWFSMNTYAQFPFNRSRAERERERARALLGLGSL